MSDYSFMKTGFSPTGGVGYGISDEDKENLEVMFSLFVSNAMINAAKYVEYCGRDGVTKTDLEYGMKYEISEFAKRDNILEDLEEMRREYHAELEREDAEYEDENFTEEEDEINSMITDDSEIEPFRRIIPERVTTENREFIIKMHHYYDNWDSWIPVSPIQQILRNAINLI